ncbi:UNVERIFIED_CONTAM: Peroxidase 5 [Sesamum radiatum]|uniref:peroxidase n=1 Tax=Sesamum radiatum TaxID=300843 RepID=A0AAW2KCK5_SESRA
MSYKQLKAFILLLVCLYIVESEAQLQVGFYQSSCGLAELIVKQEVTNGFIKDKGVAAGLVRLHFHDCFVRGCDGSVLIDSTPSNTAEKDAPPNNPSLRGFEVIDNAKSKLEAICKGVVSCADILAFAARDSIEIVRDMLDIYLAHSQFSAQLYNFNSNSSQDPTLDNAYAVQLRQQCPQNSNANLVVPMDPSSPAITDVGYYRGVLANRGLLTSDQTLLTSPKTQFQVVQNVQNPFLWRNKFAAAMVKMGKIGVLTGNAGEVRANCRVINS